MARHYCSKHHKSAAFTLVEVSIIIILIGIVIGGVLATKNMITSASERKQISQLQKLEIEINSFRTKFNCLPGDCEYATTALGSTDPEGNTLANGNGDGIIRGTSSDTDCLEATYQAEPTQLFWQLNASKIASYSLKKNLWSDVALPYSAYDGQTILAVTCMKSLLYPTTPPAFVREGNSIIFGINPYSPNNATNNNGYGSALYSMKDYGIVGKLPTVTVSPIGIPLEIIRQMDTKMDDGIPDSGTFGVLAFDTGCMSSASTYDGANGACMVTAGKNLRQ